MFDYTDAENTGTPMVPAVDPTPTDPREDHEESVLSHRLRYSSRRNR